MSRQPPVARVGEFHVLDFVGAGGMGEVFRAVHARSGQVAAVKFLSGGADLPPETRQKWRERFAHEARVQNSLRHPNLAAFYEWHEIAGTPCIVMELVDGQTLTACLGTGGLPLANAVSVFRRVVEAVAFMHARGVIHRDIKTSNIKINARGEVKLLDFGIAKTGDMARLTATGAFVGTLQYLSPEQVRGKEADARCDVWALGALFYETLCGSPPFEATTWGELIEKVARAQYEPLSVRRADVPREVEHIVRRCLQKQPSARFADAGELLGALERLESGAKIKRKSARSKAAKTPFWVVGGAGVLGLATWFLWPAPTSAPPENLVARTSVPLPHVESPTKIPDDPAQPASNPNNAGNHKITINTFEGAAQTEVFRNGQSLGNAPCDVRARLGETIELDLVRPGFQKRRESITITASRSEYTFSLDPLSP